VKTEADLWNALVQSQQDYAQSLASLDGLILDGTSTKPLPLEQGLIEEAAKVRQVAYTKYRQARDELTAFCRQ